MVTKDEILAFINAFVLFFFTVFGCFHLIFATTVTENFIYTGTLLHVSLLIVVGVKLYEWLLKYLHKTFGVDELVEHRNNELIGLGAMAIISGAVKIVFFWIAMDGETILFITSLYFFTITCIFFSFYWKFSETITWNFASQLQKNHIFFNCLLIDFVLLFTVTRAAAMEHNSWKFMLPCQFGPLAVFAASIYNFAYMLVVGISFQTGDNTRSERQEVMTGQEVMTSEESVGSKKIPNAPEVFVSRPLCNICSAFFEDEGKHVPRTLKECGHTICEDCVGKLLKHNSIACPYCKKNTLVVNGSATTLPKNFALLETMQEVEQKIQDELNTIDQETA